MSDLDDKLREILSDAAIILEANRDVPPSQYEVALNLFLEQATTAVKQAFADEYLMVEHPKQGHLTVMTGQEWYDRLVAEWLKLPKDHGFVDMQESAKRAAGLSE